MMDFKNRLAMLMRAVLEQPCEQAVARAEDQGTQVEHPEQNDD